MQDTLPFRSLVTITCAGFILWFGKPFLVPLAYALMIALVLYPSCRYLEKKGLGRGLAIALPLFGVVVLFAGLLVLLGYEMAVLAGEWPLLQERTDPFLAKLHHELETEFGWTTAAQEAWLKSNLERMSQNMGTMLRESVRAMFEAVVSLVIIPIYVALLLIYRGRLVSFLTEIAPGSMRSRMPEVLADTVSIFSRFIRGMVLVYLTVGLLNTIGLLVIGVEDALVYGMLTAIMTIIPYFGIVVSAMLPMTMSWLHTGNIWQPLGIAGVFTLVQYLEANLIFPYIVGRHVHLNTLAAVVVIFLGALVWGVSGMVLFLPFLAVFRIFANHFPELQPWTRLIGK